MLVYSKMRDNLLIRSGGSSVPHKQAVVSSESNKNEITVSVMLRVEFVRAGAKV